MKHGITLLCILGLSGPVLAEPASPERLDAVTERGRHVMPFSLEKTTHVFTPDEQGGIQQVIVKDPADKEQISLIRGHLAKLAERFPQGDFSGPASIHGQDMPGLKELNTAPKGAVEYRYRELPNGAEIVYVSRDPALVDAVHRYFEAQLSDHARHSVPGHSMHKMHHP